MKAKAKSDRAQELKQVRTPVNLKFLDDFMKRMSISIQDIAKVMNISRQAVYYWFVHDDATLSKMQDLFDILGYDLVFSLTRDQEEDKQTNVQIKMAMQEEPIFGPRLDFLTKAIRIYKIRKTEVSAKMKISATTIYYWQTHDDCLISNLFEFARVAGLTLNISITPKVQTDGVAETERAHTVRKDDAHAFKGAMKYKELKKTVNVIGYFFENFLSDADSLVSGDVALRPKVRRMCLQISDLLKDFRSQSMEASR